jgi:hypothetical protein
LEGSPVGSGALVGSCAFNGAEELGTLSLEDEARLAFGDGVFETAELDGV